jgi:plastocyanin
MPTTRLLWLVLVIAGCGGGSTTTPPPPPPPVAPPPPPPPGGVPPNTAGVAMNSTDDGYGSAVNSFLPGAVTVARTGTVTWTNSTGVLHNVTFSQATGVPASIPSFATGSNARTFNTAGTVSYQCTNHAGMTGQVTVQ